MTTATTYNYLHWVSLSNLINWSVAHLLENDLGFSNKYPFVRIGDVLYRNTDTITVADDVEYKQVTLKINGGGAVLRGTKVGKDIGTKKQYRISVGQFIMSKIDAQNGAFGVVPKELDGAIVTGDFPSFNVNEERVNPSYLYLLSATQKFVQFAQSCSRGTTNRQRIDILKFLNVRIPLPSLEVQNAIVAAYNNKIQQATTLEDHAKQVEHDIDDYLLSELGMLHKDYPILEPSISVTCKPKSEYVISHKQDTYATCHWGDEIKKEYKYLKFVRCKDVTEWGYDRINVFIPQISTYPLIKLNALIKEGYRGKSPIYKESETSFVLNQKCNRWNEIDLSYKKSVDKKWLSTIKKDMFTQEGDLLINSTGEGTLGRTTVITKDFKNLLYDSHLLLIRVNEQILPKYLVLILNSPYGQDQINTYKSALATKQTELGLDNLKKIQIPLPPLDVQNEIVARIMELSKQAKSLYSLASTTRAAAIQQFEQAIFK